MAKFILCCVFMRNPKSCVLGQHLYSGSLSACKKYVAQAIAKGQDRNRLAIVPLQLLAPASPAGVELDEEVVE